MAVFKNDVTSFYTVDLHKVNKMSSWVLVLTSFYKQFFKVCLCTPILVENILNSFHYVGIKMQMGQASLPPQPNILGLGHSLRSTSQGDLASDMFAFYF